ncbi:GNAT family N-acetyltransferase [Pedococcus sp. NPDC057267]|uniref:GNAT family N-acetyltransferase n=1 Tax=Pedococcus sp. NPDC057267 TaxID=3346077 RepID=UPI0036374C85
MAVTVRAATADDAETLHTVAAATFALACPPHVTPESVATFVADVLSVDCFQRYLADPARDLFLAEDANGPAGYAMLVDGEPADPDVRAALRLRPTAELSKIYVLPGHHGAGVSRLLMQTVLDSAAGRGAAGVWLGVNQLNERAQRFYRKSGFEQVGTKRFLVGARYEDDYVFERAL